MTARLRKALATARAADGFTLIEMVITLVIATVIFSAMAAAGLAGVRASTVARQNQQAVDVLNRLVEEARGEDFTSLAMVTSDLSVGDTDVTGGGTPTYSVPNGIGTENVWAQATGSVNPHVDTYTTDNGVVYTTKTYVTYPTGITFDNNGQPAQKRLTVVASWSAYGEEREQVVSTLFTETTRGLPLPRYGVTPTSVTTQTKNPSTTLDWGFQVRNRGARDTFNISASAGTWAYYVDADCDGSRDAGENTLLTNTDSALGDTRVDTGPLESNNYPVYCVVAQRAIPSGELGTSSVTFNLESSAQPSATGADVSVGAFTVTVTTGSTGGTPTPTGTSTAPTTVCQPTPAGAGTPFGFRNGIAGASGATTSQLVSTMTENICMNQLAAANYSTDAGSGTGRSLTTGGTVTTATASQRAEWRWNPSTTKTVATGTATVSVMVSCPVAGSNVTLNGALGTFNEKNSIWSSKGTGTAAVSCATANTWTRVDVPISVATAFTVANKVQGQPQHLSARLWVTGGSAGQQIRVDYEQAGAKSFLYVNVS